MKHKFKQLFKTYGKNELQAKAQPSWIVSYLGQFKEFTTIILGATALFSILSGHLFDGIADGLHFTPEFWYWYVSGKKGRKSCRIIESICSTEL